MRIIFSKRKYLVSSIIASCTLHINFDHITCYKTTEMLLKSKIGI